MSARAGLNEVIPGRLYQRGQFLTWPASQKRELLDKYGITLVVNLWSKIDADLSPEPGELGRTYINWLTSPSAVPRNADLYAKFTASLIQEGHCALIHCEAGRGRSVWFTTRVYSELQNTDAGAWAAVSAACPRHDLTPALRADLGITS